MTTDRLTLARAFEDAGIQRDKAEAVAGAVFDAIHDNVATKTDLAAVRVDLERVERRLSNEIALLRRDVKIWTGSVMVIVAGLLLAAIRYLPSPHG
jgi:hypothetical protein